MKDSDIIKVLIVEDESILAELYGEFINRFPYYKTVGIASNLSDAYIMIKKLEPKLVILDNYLPDGQGIQLLEFIVNNHIFCYTIFLTASIDMELFRKALLYGAFNYLIKPVSYEHLKFSLNNFRIFLNHQSNDTFIDQRKISELFKLKKNFFYDNQKVIKGIESSTLNHIKNLFTEDPSPKTVTEIANILNFGKTTARRYLEYCVEKNFLKIEIVYGKIGRPERKYSLK